MARHKRTAIIIRTQEDLKNLGVFYYTKYPEIECRDVFETLHFSKRVFLTGTDSSPEVWEQRSDIPLGVDVLYVEDYISRNNKSEKEVARSEIMEQIALLHLKLNNLD